MKRKLALLMAAVMLITTLGSASFASDASDAIIVEEEAVEAELTDDEKTEESEVDTENFTDESQSEEVFIVSVEEADDPSDEPVIVDIIASGVYGDDVTWTLGDDGTLTISGNGSMSNKKGNYFVDRLGNYKEMVEQVIIENGVTSICTSAFYECSNLKSVSIPSSVTIIEDMAFEYCTSLTSVTIPSSVTSIGICSFAFCSSLISVSIPSSVTSIGLSAFLDCTSLTDVNLPTNLKVIENYLFCGCTSLESVTISSNVTSIGDGAFSGCSSLASITIPSSVTNIGDQAFFQCSSLTNVYYAGSESEWSSIEIASNNDCLSNATVYYSSTGSNNDSDKSNSGYFGWSFRNGYDAFGYTTPYTISEDRYAEVFGNAYIAVAKAAGEETYSSMIEEWAGNCYGMCVTAILFDLGMLDFSSYSSQNVLNKYSTKIIQNGKYFYAMSSEGSAITNLIERYQILQNGTNGGYNDVNSSKSWLEGSYYTLSSGSSYSHISGGDYISKVLDWIKNSDEPLIINMYDEGFAHSVVVRTDKEPEEQENGWWKVYIYDPNHPYMDQSIIDEYTDELFSPSLASYYVNTWSEDTYLELNPSLNLWRFCGSNNGSDPDAYYGTTLEGYLSYFKNADNEYKPSYIIAYSISNVNYPLSFNGTEPWMEEWSDAVKKTTGISYTKNSNITIYSSDREEIIVIIQEGVPLIYDDNVYNNMKVASGSSGGRLTIPYTEFIVEYTSGDDISIFGNESVINIDCNGAVSLDLSMEEDQVIVTGNGSSQITISVSDVYSNNDYTSVDLYGTLDDKDSISIKLTDDELVINSEIDGDTFITVSTDNVSDTTAREIGEISEANQDIYEYDVTSEGKLILDSDGIYRYYVNGVFDSSFNGIVGYDGGQFFVANGVLCSDAHGLNLYNGTWYFLAYGQVQTQYTGLALYDGEWFYITEGILDTSKTGLIPYDGETFLVSEGHLLTSYNGLWLNATEIGGDNKWYFIAAGQVQDVSQVVMYDGAFFVVENGILNTSYNGTIEYDGATFTVVNGQLY